MAERTHIGTDVSYPRNLPLRRAFPARMSRSRQKPSNAQQRDAELARAEAELKSARKQMEAVKAEISRSCRLLAVTELCEPQVRPSHLPAQGHTGPSARKAEPGEFG